MEKRTADLIALGIDWLITVDGERRVLQNAGVAIVDGRFADIGLSQEIAQRWSAKKVLDGQGKVAVPGFIDNHLHASFQLSRGLADELNAQEFLFKRMYPYEAAMTESDVYVSSLLAGWELLRHGVTCFVDPGNYHPQQTIRACQEVGIRVFVARSTFDKGGSVLGLLPESMIDTTDSALEATAAIIDEFGGSIERGWSASASFRGLNNASDDLIRGLYDLALSKGTFVQTHGAFNYSTMDASIAQHEETEIQRLERLGVLNEHFLLVHGGWLQPQDVALVAKRRPTVVHAPSSSMHNGYGNLTMGSIPELLALGVNVSLGSDHASSGSVDMCREMFLAACGHKEARVNPRVMPPESVVEMATINGAKGIGASESIGSIEVGKLADMVLFDDQQPEWLPLYNPISNLVYSAPGSTVDTVLVGGRIVVQGGHLTLVEEPLLQSEVRNSAEAILQRMGARAESLSKWNLNSAV